MSWDSLNIDVQQSKHESSKAKQMEDAYKQVFSTDLGKKVLDDLTKKFIWNNDTAHNEQNVNYVAAYHNGEAGAIKYIHHIINKVEKSNV